MYARPTTVVRLEGPLALSHGGHSSLHLAPAATRMKFSSHVPGRNALGKFLVANRRGPHADARVASRITTFGRLLEGTDVLPLWSNLTKLASQHSHPCTSITLATVAGRVSRTRQGMLQNCWHSDGKLLASANAVSYSDGARLLEQDRFGSERRQSSGAPPNLDPRHDRHMTRTMPSCPVHTCG